MNAYSDIIAALKKAAAEQPELLRPSTSAASC